MTPGNRDHVTWRELNLALDPVREDLAEVKADVKALRVAAERRSFLGPRGRTVVNGLLVAAPAAVVSAVVALLLGSG